MSPEQLTVGGTPNPLTDIWSLGACTFAAFTARIPFEGEVLGDIVLKVCVEPLPVAEQVNPDVPEGLDAWFLRACHREPAKRFQTVEEMSRVAREGLRPRRGAGRDDVRRSRAVRTQARRARTALEELPTTCRAGGHEREDGAARRDHRRRVLMVGLVGFLAWREKQAAEDAEKAPPAVVAPPANAPAPPFRLPR